MAEEYVGTKFKTIFARKDPPNHEDAEKLIAWCKRFHELGLAPGGSGNMSFRAGQGFLVTPTGSNLGLVKASELVEVLQVDSSKREVVAAGSREPSSESMMHAAIYKARAEVNAVFHGHNDRLLQAAERLGLPMTEVEQPYGTPEVVSEIMKILGTNLFLIIRNHGFVSMGGTLGQAGRNTETVLARLLAAR